MKHRNKTAIAIIVLSSLLLYEQPFYRVSSYAAAEKTLVGIGTAGETESEQAQNQEQDDDSRTEYADEAVSGKESTQTESERKDDTDESVYEGEDEKVSEQITETSSQPEVRSDGPIPDIVKQFIESEEALGASWSVELEDMNSHTVYGYHQDERMQSASVIKIFIMITVFDRILYPDKETDAVHYTESYEGELDSLLSQMITVSSNEAANSLVAILGDGDFDTGKNVVNACCQQYGFTKCHLGRRFMAENPTDDNYISADDVRRALEMIFQGTMINQEASARMMTYLRGQQTLYKIPAGLPEGYTTANKTGEMPDGYGLGSIENDACICMGPYGDFILVVLSNGIGSRTSEADQKISQIAACAASWFAQQYGHSSGQSDQSESGQRETAIA